MACCQQAEGLAAVHWICDAACSAEGARSVPGVTQEQAIIISCSLLVFLLTDVRHRMGPCLHAVWHKDSVCMSCDGLYVSSTCQSRLFV
jgi:hypothetical protein